MDNVDEEVTDEVVVKGKKVCTKNRGRARMSSEGIAGDDGSDVSTDDELQLPDCGGYTPGIHKTRHGPHHQRWPSPQDQGVHRKTT